MKDEDGDMIVSWREVQAERATRRAKFLRDMKRLRKNGFAAWICSLKEGDEVVLRLPWSDKGVPGGERHPGWVKWVKEDRFCVHWMRFGGDAGISVVEDIFYRPWGGGGPYRRIEHPTREVIYSGDLGYVFKDEWEDWKRRRKAWETRRAA